MAGPYRERARLILAKIETTSGTDAAPVATVDAVRSVGFPLVRIGYLEAGLRDDVQTAVLMSTPRAAAAGRFATFDITMEVAGSVAAGPYTATTSKPEVDVFLRMAGMGRTVVTTGGSESITYTTIDGGMETATCWVYQAGKLIKMVGCVATMKLSGTAGQRGLFTFTVTGVVTADPTEAALPTFGVATLVPPPFIGASPAIGSWTNATAGDPLVFKKVDVDLGNVAADRDSAGAADGIIGYLVSDRKARQTADVEVPGLSTFDAFALSKALVGALPTSTYKFGTVQYNRMTVQTGVWALEAPTPGADKSINTHTLQGNLAAGAPLTGRELNLVFD